MISQDAPNFVSDFYEKWAVRNGFTVKKYPNGFKMLRPGVAIESHFWKLGTGTNIDFNQWDTTTERWKDYKW